MENAGVAGHGEYKVPGGKLVVVDLEVAGGRITAAQVSGDFFMEPAEARDAIDAALLGCSADAGEAALTTVVGGAFGPETQAFGITPEGVAVAVRRALDAVGAA